MADIEKILYQAIRKVKPSLQETELYPTTRFDDYMISSMEMSMIVFEIEDEFDIEIPAHTLMDFATVGDVCIYIEKLLKEKSPEQLQA